MLPRLSLFHLCFLVSSSHTAEVLLSTSEEGYSNSHEVHRLIPRKKLISPTSVKYPPGGWEITISQTGSRGEAMIPEARG